jgi:hypothetical protein
MARLNSFAKKADARKDAIHRTLESRFVGVCKHERPAASHQVGVVLLCVGNRVIDNCPVFAHIGKLSERQNALGICEKSLDGHSVQVINRRHRNTFSAATTGVEKKKPAAC